MMIMMTTGSVVFFIIVRNRVKHYRIDGRSRVVLSNLTFATALVFVELLYGGGTLALRLPFDMMVSLVPMMTITSSFWEEDVALRLSQYFSLPVLLLVMFYILRGAGFLPNLSDLHYLSMTGLIAVIICLMFICAIVIRMREVRQVMKHGNVWSSACMSIDMLYLLVLLVYVLALLVAARISYLSSTIVSMIVSFLLAFELAALSLRAYNDSLFIIWRRHEKRIVESMRLSQTDVASDSTKINDTYKDIYTRIVTLFESEKPYLNSDLTINDIVKVIFTNKLYISRAISQFTGRNFCQFVNYYRVSYSIQLFRNNPELKVIELATQSGFNSSVSYSMAFRLYMNESPSDWCRKEKIKLARWKK